MAGGAGAEAEEKRAGQGRERGFGNAPDVATAATQMFCLGVS